MCNILLPFNVSQVQDVADDPTLAVAPPCCCPTPRHGSLAPVVELLCFTVQIQITLCSQELQSGFRDPLRLVFVALNAIAHVGLLAETGEPFLSSLPKLVAMWCGVCWAPTVWAALTMHIQELRDTTGPETAAELSKSVNGDGLWNCSKSKVEMNSLETGKSGLVCLNRAVWKCILGPGNDCAQIQCEKDAPNFTRYQAELVNFGCDREEMLNKVVTVYSVALETETSVSVQASDADMMNLEGLEMIVVLVIIVGFVKALEHLGLLEDNFEGYSQSHRSQGDLEKAKIVPIFQRGRKDDPVRPFSLHSVPGKIMERTLPESMVRYMEDREVIQDSQHGFTKGESCLTNPLAFYDGVTTSVDKGRATDVIYLNLCKVFDRVLHNTLLSKLKSDGFNE
ncbi:hypothetical protein WISP_33082 [Willisornis vidua]|uniref:Reverse transcriptase domain-containing protein n=1 Tax=Willisornis vidua TaxID=1566151 RepID=A0ABQ9DK88_9PASS|nr:hypothetical protein WISP_33082 [Willisornis vidua]